MCNNYLDHSKYWERKASIVYRERDVYLDERRMFFDGVASAFQEVSEYYKLLAEIGDIDHETRVKNAKS